MHVEDVKSLQTGTLQGDLKPRIKKRNSTFPIEPYHG